MIQTGVHMKKFSSKKQIDGIILKAINIVAGVELINEWGHFKGNSWNCTELRFTLENGKTFKVLANKNVEYNGKKSKVKSFTTKSLTNALKSVGLPLQPPDLD